MWGGSATPSLGRTPINYFPNKDMYCYTNITVHFNNFQINKPSNLRANKLTFDITNLLLLEFMYIYIKILSVNFYI